MATGAMLLLPGLAIALPPAVSEVSGEARLPDPVAMLQAWAGAHGADGALHAAAAQALAAFSFAERAAGPPRPSDGIWGLDLPADTVGQGVGPALGRAHALAHEAADAGTEPRDLVLQALQVAQRPPARGALPAMPRFDALPDALEALLAWYGYAPSAEERARLAATASLPPDVADAVTRIVEAHLLQAEATRMAIAPALVGGAVARPDALDLGLLLDARDAVASALLEALPRLRVVPGAGPLEICGVLVLNLTQGDSAYACNAVLSIDAGGHDVYRNNAGGATSGAALLVDLDGSDVYDATFVGTGGVNGAGSVGSGFLFDHAGDDTYSGTVTAGGGQDTEPDGGEDCVCGGAANGGAGAGTGFLLDMAGNDTYTASVRKGGGVNGGARLGAGFLMDLAGDDHYTGSVGRDGGVNGGATGAGSTGFLLDLDGDDAYVGAAGSGGVNGGTSLGAGFLLDGGGTNRFEATLQGPGGSNGGAGGYTVLSSVVFGPVDVQAGVPGGLGVLIAGDGDDTYIGNGTTQGAGDFMGVGVLVDAGGRNAYTAGPDGLAQGAGRNLGTGILLDLGSESTFDLQGTTVGQGAGLQGVGLLLRANEAGDSTYLADLTARPSATTGAGVGLRLDLGRVHFENPPSFACAGPELQGLQPSPGDPVLAEVHLCAPDDGAQEALVNPVTGQPLAAVPKPALPCSGLGLPSWVDCTFLESNQVNPTTSGGLAMLTGKDPLTEQRILRARLTMVNADGVCGIGCFMGLFGFVTNLA